MSETKYISNDDEIIQFLHCGLCLQNFRNQLDECRGESPQSYARISIGWTEKGLQAWCVRHNANMFHIDFEGHKHPANTTRIEVIDGIQTNAVVI